MSEPLYDRLRRLKKQRREPGQGDASGREAGEPGRDQVSGREAGEPAREQVSGREAGEPGRQRRDRTQLRTESRGRRPSAPKEHTEDLASSETRRSLERLGFRERLNGALVRSVDREIGRAAAGVLETWRNGGMVFPAEAGEPVFFDVESTGLGAGAGNVAFLVGAVTVLDTSRVQLQQILLPDYPDEPEFLEWTARLLSPECLLVSYNGKGFDTNLLRSRFLMNGIRWSEPAQLDLLYPVRRLWARVLPDCRLSTIENHLLGVKRDRDVPGAEVPERYFAFLETGAGEVLRDVVAHHEQDMLSLVLLLDFLERTLAQANRRATGKTNRSSGHTGIELRMTADSSRPARAPASGWSNAPGDWPASRRANTSSNVPASSSERQSRTCGEGQSGTSIVVDAVGVARALLAAEGIESAVGWLHHACSGKKPTGEVRRSMVLLAGLMKRQGRFEEASRLWSRLFHEGQSVVAGIELAKHLEHRQKNIPAALAVCEKLRHHTGTARKDIEHRYDRLRRKASR